MTDIIDLLEYYGIGGSGGDIAACHAMIKAANEIRRLRAALKFYADPGDYAAPYTGGSGKLYFDCGTIARNALEEK